MTITGCASTDSPEDKIARMNSVHSKAWLNYNAKKEGIIITDSGLQYRVLSNELARECMPTSNASIRVNYDMRLAKSGAEIDSSFTRGTPEIFELKKMIPAWKEAIPMMHIGESWELYIPPELGYGSKGMDESVQANVVLISRIDLLASTKCQ